MSLGLRTIVLRPDNRYKTFANILRENGVHPPSYELFGKTAGVLLTGKDLFVDMGSVFRLDRIIFVGMGVQDELEFSDGSTIVLTGDSPLAISTKNDPDGVFVRVKDLTVGNMAICWNPDRGSLFQKKITGIKKSACHGSIWEIVTTTGLPFVLGNFTITQSVAMPEN